MLIVDCDPGWDDALALALALVSRDVNVVGVTTAFGNGPVAETTANARRIVGLFGREGVAVYPGAAVPFAGAGVSPASPPPRSAALEELPVGGPLAKTGAAEFITEAARRHGSALTILGIAPLTNLASALRRDERALSSIGGLVIMGGALSAGNTKNGAEFNFLSDPMAAKTTLASPIEKIVIPLETCARLPLTADFVDRLGDGGGTLAKFVRAIARERVSAIPGQNAVPFYDVLATLFALRPDLFSTERGRGDVEAHVPQRLGAFRFIPAQSGSTRVAIDIDRAAAYDVLYRILNVTSL